ncbi:hypothetical protein Ga0609869_001267 [Rhodovulum iodosum]|uniref:Uncharacterized protein n=1 Tax=Rhodovulum iodosum TaxID=68291 RepID=A0ABV3XRT7_9RHOB|nr:hypothetical protein [Rhodovulum robiginosum]RSK40026.1 hypothetical protein EJA01_00785 [Rhodovulum robiginosum]
MSPEEMRRLTRLGQLAGLLREAALADLAAARARRVRIEGAIARLDTPPAQPEGADSPASRAGAARRWHDWVRARKTVLNADLARARVGEEAARTAAAKSQGRAEALARLAARRRR